MSHTKGEWIATRGSHSYPLEITTETKTIAQIEARKSIDETEANAQLIAAAPDLLDACRKALSKFRLMYEKIEAGYNTEDLYTDSKSWPLTTLRNAITKAEQ
ncbi:hypothetical protein KAR91_43675 [Candidatus Pacearchaeota archaeon]|nr:hypothetical protein [Candidatus Pacearchaeota archaeon]